MQNHTIHFLCVLLSAALILSGDALGSTPTAGVKVVKAKKCLFPKSRKRAPSWVCDAKADGFAAAAVGSAVNSGAGISFMEQMAAADARTHLARNLSGSFQKQSAGQGKVAGSANATNQNLAGRDSALITRITDESLQGTKIIKKAYGPNGTLYVLVGIDETSVRKLNETFAAHQQQKGK